MKQWWESTEEERRQNQKRIAREIIAQGKAASASAIEQRLSVKEREWQKNKLTAMNEAAGSVDPSSVPDDWSLGNSIYCPQVMPVANVWGAFPPPPIRISNWFFTEYETRRNEPLPEETIVTAITAYRQWRVPLFGKQITSVVLSSVKWPIRQRLESVCNRDECAGAHCNCGIYAWKTSELMADYERDESHPQQFTHIRGEVWLWGRVLECSRGYRAQYAYPKAFVNTGAMSQQYAEIYGVPLI